MVHFVGSLIDNHHLVLLEGFDQAVKIVKGQCIVMCDLLVFELEWRFPNHKLVNLLEIIYPCY
jgi:hypothetical protein